MRLLNQVNASDYFYGEVLVLENMQSYLMCEFSKDPVMMIDPSELLRPEAEFADKDLSKFRDYSVDVNDPLKERVRQTYRQMHLNQTVGFVKGE